MDAAGQARRKDIYSHRPIAGLEQRTDPQTIPVTGHTFGDSDQHEVRHISACRRLPLFRCLMDKHRQAVQDPMLDSQGQNAGDDDDGTLDSRGGDGDVWSNLHRPFQHLTFPGSKRMITVAPDAPRMTIIWSCYIICSILSWFGYFVSHPAWSTTTAWSSVSSNLLLFSLFPGSMVSVAVVSLAVLILKDPGVVPNMSLEQVREALSVSASQRSRVCFAPESLHVHYCPVCCCFVERFDHHCNVIGVCVGRRSMGPFLCFLLSVTLSCVYMAVVGILLLFRIFLVEKSYLNSVFSNYNSVTVLGNLIVPVLATGGWSLTAHFVGTMFRVYFSHVINGRDSREIREHQSYMLGSFSSHHVDFDGRMNPWDDEVQHSVRIWNERPRGWNNLRDVVVRGFRHIRVVWSDSLPY